MKPPSRPGFCSITSSRKGNCVLGFSGSIKGVQTLDECVERCRGCARCGFVSFAKRHDDCSWYASCPRTLLTTPHGYHTVAVNASRSSTPAPPWRSVAPPAARFGGDAVTAGYCAETRGEDDCELGDLGFFAGVKSWRACKGDRLFGPNRRLADQRSAPHTVGPHVGAARCGACARCAVLSWSAKNQVRRLSSTQPATSSSTPPPSSALHHHCLLQDCSWYAECDLADLRRPPVVARDYGTLRLKPAPAPLPAEVSADQPPGPHFAARRSAAAAAAAEAEAEAEVEAEAASQPAAARPSIALVTLAVGGGARCALTQWCPRPFAPRL